MASFNEHNDSLSHSQQPELPTLSTDQQRAFDLFVAGHNLFITGPGGSGKTHLIKSFHQHAIYTRQHIPVCAMTGCAAILLQCSAKTIHSWSGIRIARGNKEQVIQSVLHNRFALAAWKKASGIIVDEVSMMSLKVFEILENIARLVKQNSKPFGGMQVVFIGDFFQLPPVSTPDDPENALFCFQSTLWHSVFKIKHHILLHTIFRQSDDPSYARILQLVRTGSLDPQSISILQQRVAIPFHKRHDPAHHTPTKLLPIRARADLLNSIMFNKISSPEVSFHITCHTDFSTFADSNKLIPPHIIRNSKSMHPNTIRAETERIINSMPCQPIIKLKIGTVVMACVNIDIDNQICNGSQGTVVQFSHNNHPIVRFHNGILTEIKPHVWQSEEFPTIAVSQIPIILAWAITIHKSQGATLSVAEIDIGDSVFEYGQTYVALSRIKSLDGLYISSFNPNNIKANPVVIQFYQSLPSFPSHDKK